MSRTSQSQFILMIEFMERNGDLSKLVDGAHGRVTSYTKWTELANILNLDATGTSKTVDKWKKVWSDFKNNTKRKAAKIHRSASGTGGGPACRLVLTDLEQRVLNISGTQAATGLTTVNEVGVEVPSQNTPPLLPPTRPQSSTPTVENIQFETNTEQNRPGSSSSFHVEPMQEEVSPTRQHVALTGGHRSPNMRTGGRRVLRARRTTPLRRPRPTDAASHFLASEERWQNFAREIATEHVRLRERELEQQAQWQTLFAKFLNIMENVTNQ